MDLFTLNLLNINLIINMIIHTPKPYKGIQGPYKNPLFKLGKNKTFKDVSIIKPIIE